MYSQKHSSPLPSQNNAKLLKFISTPTISKEPIVPLWAYEYRGRVGSFIKKEESCKIQQFISFSTAIK